MKILKKEYFHINGTPTMDSIDMTSTKQNYISAYIYYEKANDGFTRKPRGYYISVNKVGRGKDSCGIFESFGLFDKGATILLFEVARQSKKKDAEAITIFEKEIESIIRETYPKIEYEKEVA